MITNLMIALAIGALTGLFKHLKKNQGLLLPRIEKNGDEKILKPGFLLDMFLSAVPAGIGSILIIPSDASLVTIVLISLAASEIGLELYYKRVEDVKREQIRNLLHEFIDGINGGKDGKRE